MKTFYAIKKPIPVKFIEPLSMDASEIKEFNITIKDGKWYMGTLEHKAYEFYPSTHLIAEGINGERYAIEREIFEKTYDTYNISKSTMSGYDIKKECSFLHMWARTGRFKEECVKCNAKRETNYY